MLLIYVDSTQEWTADAVGGFVLGKTAMPAGTVTLAVDRGEDAWHVAALDASGAELRAWEVPWSLAGRPAISQVEIQVGAL